MTVKHLLVATAVLDLFIGLGWILAPEFMLTHWNITGADALTLYVGQRMGVIFFGYAIALWMVRDIPPSTARYALLVSGFVSVLGLALLSLIGVLNNTIGSSGIFAAVLESLFAVAFGYFLYRERKLQA